MENAVTLPLNIMAAPHVCLPVLIYYYFFVSEWVIGLRESHPSCHGQPVPWLQSSIGYAVRFVTACKWLTQSLVRACHRLVCLNAMETKRQSEFVSISPTDCSTTLVVIKHIVWVTSAAELFGLLWLKCLVNIMLAHWTTGTWLIDLVSYI